MAEKFDTRVVTAAMAPIITTSTKGHMGMSFWIKGLDIMLRHHAFFPIKYSYYKNKRNAVM